MNQIKFTPSNFNNEIDNHRKLIFPAGFLAEIWLGGNWL